MPEGPEIRRAADRLQRAIVDQPVVDVFFAFAHLQAFVRPLRDSRVQAIETRGKALLTHFACGLSVYSHNQLYGQWRVNKSGAATPTSRSLRFAVVGQRNEIRLYSASDISVLDAAGIAQHPFLVKLGPDLLHPSCTSEIIAERLVSARFARRSLLALLLDQSFFAGIGNYLRSEILHVAGIAPARRLGSLNDAEQAALATALHSVCHQAYHHRGITNDLARAADLKLAGASFEARRFHVFERAGQACYRCGDPIARGDDGRRWFSCSGCQR